METNTSGIAFGAILLQERKSMNCRHDKILDYAALWLVIFTSKSSSSAEQHNSNIDCEVLGTLYGLEYYATTASQGKCASSLIMNH